MQHILYTYNIADIRQEVEKRTSYLGSMRNAKNEPHLLDRLSLMKGEAFLFDEYLQEAAAEVYNWLKPFCREIVNAYSIYLSEPLKYYENLGVKLSYEGNDSLMLSLPDYQGTTISPILSFDIAYLERTISVDLTPILLTIGQADTIDYRLTIALHSESEDGEVLERPTISETYSLNCDTPLGIKDYNLKIARKVNEKNVVKIVVDSVGVEIISMKPYSTKGATKGEAIQYFYADGTSKFLKLIANATIKDLAVNTFNAVELEGDVFGKIIYHLNIPDWQDKNMFPRTDRLIREAIIHYIIFRWFEIVYPQEAKYYYDKYDNYARELQLALNSENRNLNKPYRLF